LSFLLIFDKYLQISHFLPLAVQPQSLRQHHSGVHHDFFRAVGRRGPSAGELSEKPSESIDLYIPQPLKNLCTLAGLCTTAFIFARSF